MFGLLQDHPPGHAFLAQLGATWRNMLQPSFAVAKDGFLRLEALLPFRPEMEQHKNCPLSGLSRPCYPLPFLV